MIKMTLTQSCKRPCAENTDCEELGGPCTECRETRRGKMMVCVKPAPCREDCESDEDCAETELCPECKPKKKGEGNTCQAGGKNNGDVFLCLLKQSNNICPFLFQVIAKSAAEAMTTVTVKVLALHVSVGRVPEEGERSAHLQEEINVGNPDQERPCNAFWDIMEITLDAIP